jgi:hypothetical protein
MTPVLTIEQAIEIGRPANRPDLATSSAQWVGPGWVVFHQTIEYMQNGDFFSRAVGGGVFVVNDGRRIAFSSQGPWQIQVAKLVKELGLDRQLEHWVTEQANWYSDSESEQPG